MYVSYSWNMKITRFISRKLNFCFWSDCFILPNNKFALVSWGSCLNNVSWLPLRQLKNEVSWANFMLGKGYLLRSGRKHWRKFLPQEKLCDHVSEDLNSRHQNLVSISNTVCLHNGSKKTDFNPLCILTHQVKGSMKLLN